MKLDRATCAFALTSLLFSASAQAAPDDELLAMINAYRASPQKCKDTAPEPLPPLVAEPSLARLKVERGDKLMEALRTSGYQAARAEVLTLSGPSNARDAMNFAVKSDCRLLLSKRYSAAGVSRQGNQWQIVLAQPLLSADLGDWQKAGREVLSLVNAARARERSCGAKKFKPAPALRWNATLAATALKHSRDMAKYDYFGHEGRDGSTAGPRATREGYAWRMVGENVAAGQGSAKQVVEGWLSSPGHCVNIMNGEFKEMGAAYAINAQSKATIYWTQVFGTPR
ncbi:MAG TPA: CAP domain-containing protein [Noviherbaspirillum sp.]|uniref:CAP domain-containing protein n=1 Tax=Noviherbaspirillum sp. TaxID=1926288 RepID=UPI002DDCB920|nr:CAP domain-containing protein [Noviherbaspirillum sp.]HEV2610111.1 CAP domain-containing protein [Noviherbaspirillum sp.]